LDQLTNIRSVHVEKSVISDNFFYVLFFLTHATRRQCQAQIRQQAASSDESNRLDGHNRNTGRRQSGQTEM
jgi:hypothetical protein